MLGGHHRGQGGAAGSAAPGLYPGTLQGSEAELPAESGVAPGDPGPEAAPASPRASRMAPIGFDLFPSQQA